MGHACVDEGKEFFHTPPSTPPTQRKLFAQTQKRTEDIVTIVAPEPQVIPNEKDKRKEEPIQHIVAEPKPAVRETPPKHEYPVRVVVDQPPPKPKKRPMAPERPVVIEFTGELEEPPPTPPPPYARNDRNEVERIRIPATGKVRASFEKVPEDDTADVKQPYLRGVEKAPVTPPPPGPKRAVSASPVASRKRIKSPVTARPASATPPGTPLERPGNAAPRMLETPATTTPRSIHVHMCCFTCLCELMTFLLGF